MDSLVNVRVAILVTDGFEQSELSEPRAALDKAGAVTSVVSPKGALLLPGGVMNPDALRMHPKAVDFVKAFFDADKPVAAICHGPWMVIEAGAASGRRIAAWPSLKTDLRNAGAEWVDEEVVVDGNLVTSRKPADLPAFNRAMLERFAQGRRRTHQAA